jgi:glutathione S-transferase
MKLYDTPMAPNPRRVRWVMAEKGVDDIKVVALNLIQGEHKQADYLGKAGLPNVPALEMDCGTTITESIAICRYLESLYPEPNLFGRDAREAAVIEMWLRRAEMLVANPFMLGVRHTHPALAALEAPNPPVGEYNKEIGLRGLKVLDRRLAESTWLAGERLSIADIVAYIGIDFTRMIKLQIPEDLPHLQRWMDVMRARPAAKAGM